jgi:hypothetical protein
MRQLTGIFGWSESQRRVAVEGRVEEGGGWVNDRRATYSSLGPETVLVGPAKNERTMDKATGNQEVLYSRMSAAIEIIRSVIPIPNDNL